MSDVMNTLQKNRSMFNPTDASMMAQEGSIRPDMSVREYFEMLGIDVEGPVTQLVEMAKDQMGKANPMNKMQAIAGGPQGQPPPGAQGGMPQPQPGMDSLLKNM